MIILQHNAIKASFQKSLHVVGHRFKVTTYKKLLGFVSKYALNLVVEELDRVKFMGFDKSRCGGCTLTCTHDLSCACQLASFVMGSIPLKSIHVIWIRLSFEDIATQQCSFELSFEKEFGMISKRFKELDVAGKVNIKTKLQEITFLEKTSIYAPHDKVKTKDVVKMAQPSESLLSLNMWISFTHNMIVVRVKNLVKDRYHKFYQHNPFICLISSL